MSSVHRVSYTCPLYTGRPTHVLCTQGVLHLSVHRVSYTSPLYTGCPTHVLCTQGVLHMSSVHRVSYTCPLYTGRPTRVLCTQGVLHMSSVHRVSYTCPLYTGCPTHVLCTQGVLQLAKVCAVISMSRSSLAESKHTYTIPLTSTTSDSARAADGVLELSVSYSRASHTTTSEEVPVVPTSMVTLSIGVLRACGLKDVVAAALEREPSLLVQPAQVGVNSFVRLTLPFSCSKVCLVH